MLLLVVRVELWSRWIDLDGSYIVDGEKGFNIMR